MTKWKKLWALHGHLDEYRLDKLLDESASNHIYRALDVILQRYVKLRVFAPPSPATPEQLQRLLREAQTLAQLAHPKILRDSEAYDFRWNASYAVRLLRLLLYSREL